MMSNLSKFALYASHKARTFTKRNHKQNKILSEIMFYIIRKDILLV